LMKDGMVLSGSLEFLNLGDLIQLLGSNGSTGILKIMGSHTQEPGVVYIIKGNPVNAFSGSLKGTDALFSLFGWIDGEFEFSSEEVTSDKVITMGRMQIILDGLSKLDDGEIEKFGAPDEEEDVADSPGAEEGGPLIKGPLVDYMYIVDEEEYQEGQDIVTEDKHGNWIWVVVEGVVQIIKNSPKGPLKLARITTGAFIGSMATFLVSGNIRGATSRALTTVSLGTLDISSIGIPMENGLQKGNVVEFDVSFQSGNEISLLIPEREKGTIEHLIVGTELNNIEFYSPFAMFQGNGVVSSNTKISTGPKRGDYSLDIVVKST